MGRDHRDLRRVRDRRVRGRARADDGDGDRLVVDSPLRLPRRGDPLAPGLGGLRSLGRAERDPPGEPRHADAAADVHDPDRGSDVRGGARRVCGAEDLLLRVRRDSLPLPVPHRRRLLRHQVRVRPRASVGDGDRADRRRSPDRRPGPGVLAAGRALVGRGEGGRGDPRPPAGLLHGRLRCPEWSAGSRCCA